MPSAMTPTGDALQPGSTRLALDRKIGLSDLEHGPDDDQPADDGQDAEVAGRGSGRASLWTAPRSPVRSEAFVLRSVATARGGCRSVVRRSSLSVLGRGSVAVPRRADARG